MAMQGNLKDMSVPDLIQHNCEDHKTARLVIRHRGAEASLFFQDGNVQFAQTGDCLGDEAVYRILSWEEGTFELETGLTPPSQNITRTWTGLLMEGARRLDETQIEPIFEPEVNQMAQLDDLLKQLSGDVTGYIASVVVGTDGLTIAQNAQGKANPEQIGAQMTLLVKLVDTSMAKLGDPVTEEDLLTTDNAYILFRWLEGKSYFLGVAVDRNKASLGNLRLMSRIYAERLSKAMPKN